MSKIIRGSGGGNKQKSPPKPTRAPDTLNSRQFVTIQDLISEGEIEGWATASKENRTKGTAVYNTAALKDVFLTLVLIQQVLRLQITTIKMLLLFPVLVLATNLI